MTIRPLVGVSWIPDPRFRATVEPVLDRVEAVEHTLDHGFGPAELPPSTRHVLAVYGDSGRLFGHGVEASPFSADRAATFDRYLEGLARHRPQLVDYSDHVGYSTGGAFTSGAPLPSPEVAEQADVVVERLTRLRSVLGVAVGLENLALAFSRRQALAQGPFVHGILARTDGFLHLDLHNLWCQLQNFGLAPETLLATWPLGRVGRIHVSGGSDRDGVRRDTHDEGVPEAVWELLASVLPRTPGCRVVVLEQMPFALDTAAQQQRFRDDLARLHAVRDAVTTSVAAPREQVPPAPPRVGTPSTLRALQRAVLDVLDRFDGADAVGALQDHPDAVPYAAWVDDLEPRMLRVGHELVHRWGVRDPHGGEPVAPPTIGG